MEKQILIMKLIDDLLKLSDEAYHDTKDYWKEHPVESENLADFIQKLFEYVDCARKAGAANADA